MAVNPEDSYAVGVFVNLVFEKVIGQGWAVFGNDTVKKQFNCRNVGELYYKVREIESIVRNGLIGKPQFRGIDVSAGELKTTSKVYEFANLIKQNIARRTDAR